MPTDTTTATGNPTTTAPSHIATTIDHGLGLRDYQAEALDALAAAYRRGVRRPVVVLPTGSGKTVIFAHLAARMAAKGRTRMLILAHRTELIEQAAAKVRRVCGGDITVGICKASRNEIDAQIVVASVQTLANAARRDALAAAGIGIVIADEFHHYAAEAATFLAVLRSFSDAFTVGFSATPSRTDHGALGDIWDEICYSRSIGEMIEGGYLVPVRGIHVEVADLALDAVSQRGGDFTPAALSRALLRSLAPTLVARAYTEHAADRPGILFAPTVAAAYEFADALAAAGFGVETVHGGLPDTERAAILDRFQTGATQILSSVLVLTEGFDAPHASCAVIARPTRSLPLLIQMAGRVLRPSPGTGKTDALILDVVGASARLNLATVADLTHTDPAHPAEPKPAPGPPEPREATGEPALVDYATGERITATEVSLFGASSYAWERTTGKGIWFVTVDKAAYLFCYPTTNGDWLPCAIDAGHAGPIGQACDLRAAKRACEARAGGTGLSRKSWRRDDVPATPAQLGALARSRVTHAPGVSKGEASRLLDVHYASRALDRLVWTEEP